MTIPPFERVLEPFPPLGPNIKALMVWPRFPPSFWGFEGVLEMVPEKAVAPPLGLVTVAALCPATWTVRLVDHAFEELRDEDLLWADLVMVSAMRAQRVDAVATLARARSLGRRTFIGGPWASSEPDLVLRDADHVLVGEAEEVFADIAAELEQGTARKSVPRLGKTRCYAESGAALRPAAPEQIRVDVGAVLARVSVSVRVLRHHHDLRTAAKDQDLRAGNRGARHAAPAGLAGRGVHCR